MGSRNAGLTADPLFVGATRPPIRWGVTYAALLLNLVSTIAQVSSTYGSGEAQTIVENCGNSMLLCARDARFFDLVLLSARTRLPALLANRRYWKAGSYSPLALDLPDLRGHRCGITAELRMELRSRVARSC